MFRAIYLPLCYRTEVVISFYISILSWQTKTLFRVKTWGKIDDYDA